MSASTDEPVELAGVLAGDLVHDVGRQMPELLLDEAGRLRPDTVRVRIVRAPHERLDAHVLDQLGADRIELEGGPALAAPVVAPLHREPGAAGGGKRASHWKSVRSSAYGIQPMPLSPNEMRMFG